MLFKKILSLFRCPCKNCRDWIILGFCENQDCKYFSPARGRGKRGKMGSCTDDCCDITKDHTCCCECKDMDECYIKECACEHVIYGGVNKSNYKECSWYEIN